MNWQEVLDDAEVAFREGDFERALSLCDRAHNAGPEAQYFSTLLQGDVLLDSGDPEAALECYESLADPEVEDPTVDCARGIALFELIRFDQADEALDAALQKDPENPDAHHVRGLIAELRGQDPSSHFASAAQLDPERFDFKTIGQEEFQAIVDESIDQLPAPVRDAIKGIPVLIAELPHIDDLRSAEPPLSPSSLGMFVGVPPGQTSWLDAPSEPPKILLFKRNLERAFSDRATLLEEIQNTVIHEVGHALGLDEEELLERGLE